MNQICAIFIPYYLRKCLAHVKSPFFFITEHFNVVECGGLNFLYHTFHREFCFSHPKLVRVKIRSNK